MLQLYTKEIVLVFFFVIVVVVFVIIVVIVLSPYFLAKKKNSQKKKEEIIHSVGECACVRNSKCSINYHCAVILYISAVVGYCWACLWLCCISCISKRARRLEECKCIAIRYAFCSYSPSRSPPSIRYVAKTDSIQPPGQLDTLPFILLHCRQPKSFMSRVRRKRMNLVTLPKPQQHDYFEFKQRAKGK